MSAFGFQMYGPEISLGPVCKNIGFGPWACLVPISAPAALISLPIAATIFLLASPDRAHVAPMPIAPSKKGIAARNPDYPNRDP